MAERGRPRRAAHPRAAVSADSYGLVLLLVLVTYVVAASAEAPRAQSIVVLIQILTAWFALRTSGAGRAVRIAAVVAFGTAAMVALVASVSVSEKPASVILLTISALLYLAAPIAIIRHLALRPAVDSETMLGAVAAYVLVGMMYAFVYELSGVVQSGPFFGPTVGDGTTSQVLFFSFTTLTTTGYGNLVPVADLGQTTAVTEMLFGQLFLVTTVGKIVSAWRPGRWSSATAVGSEPDAD